VRIGVTIRGSWQQIRRQWHAWRSRLRRDRAALALVTLLSLGLFEPLLCIIHCQIWIPYALQTHFATHDQMQAMGMAGMHHMPGMIGMVGMPGMAGMHHMPGMMPAAPIALSSPYSLPDGCAQHMGNSSDAPMPPPPSPVHEVMSTTLLLMLVVLQALTRPSGALASLMRVFIPLPLRPPILIAG
jgi:hypothetical protein